MLNTTLSFLKRYWLPLAAGILVLVCLKDIMAAYNFYWSDQDGYYTHAPLVPLVFGYMVWKNRFRLGRMEHKGGWAGVLLVVLGCLGVLGALVIQAETMAGPAIILLLVAVIWGTMGWQSTRVLLFPILFLYTVIPLPPGMLDGPTGGMQLMSSTIAANIMQWTGIDVIRQGNIIESSSLPTSLQVAGVCSGLKLLISALMFSFFFAYVTRSAWWKKCILVALALPLSIIINSLRIVAIGYAGVWTYSDVTMSKVHDYSATPALIVCFMLFLFIAKLIGAKQYHDFDEQGDTPPQPSRVRFTAASGTVIGVLVLAALYASLVADLNKVPKGELDPAAMPLSFGSWISHDAPVDKDTRDQLAKADLLSRYYVNQAASTAPVMVFISTAIDPIALHDPHTCLPGGGLRIVGEEPMTLSFDKPTSKTVNATLLTTQDEIGTKGYILHWYVAGNDTYPDTKLMNIGYFKRRIGDLGTVFLQPFAVESIKKEVFSRQIRWYRFSTDETNGGNVEYLKKFIKEFIAAGK